MAERKTLCTRVPEEWLEEIDLLVARKFPGRTRSDWLFGVVEHELIRQREGRTQDSRLGELLTLVRDVHGVIVPQGSGHAKD